MSLLRNITSGLRSLFQKEQVDRELDEELRAYQEMATDEKMKQGVSRKEALRAVLVGSRTGAVPLRFGLSVAPLSFAKTPAEI